MIALGCACLVYFVILAFVVVAVCACIVSSWCSEQQEEKNEHPRE